MAQTQLNLLKNQRLSFEHGSIGHQRVLLSISLDWNVFYIIDVLYTVTELNY